jgi:glycosyl hydrolase family 76/ricin-type beta-trefoil lectin protein
MLKRASILAAVAASAAVAIAVTTAQSHAETTPGPVAVAPSANVAPAFAALNSAFLSSNGTQRFYKESLNKGDKDYFWRQALDIQAAEDVYESTKSTATRDLIGQLLDTFLQQNKGGGGLYDWNWNEYNDDLLWAGLAFARGYQVTGNKTYLTQAQYAFNRVYDRGWDNSLGGGVWWDIRKGEKSALSNSPAVILGCLIFQSNNDHTYLDKAKAIYNWTRSNLLDQSSGAVHEKKNANGTLDGGETVYSAGAFVSAAQAIFRNTGQQNAFNDAKLTTDWVISKRTTNGIMTSGQREGTWQSEFARGMGEFVRENNLWNQYYDWMKRNADAAWSMRRTDKNLTWNRWDAKTPTDDTRAVEAIGAVIMQAVTPASKPTGTTPPPATTPPNGTTPPTGNTPPAASGALVSNWNGKCVDVPKANFAAGQRLNAWTCNNGGNQKWEAVNGGLRTQNNLCLDTAGGSTANGAVIQLATCTGAASQKFELNSAGDVVNTQSQKCLDIMNWNAAEGAPLALWTCNGGANQKWHRV